MPFSNSELVGILDSIDLGSSIAEQDKLLQSARVETSAFADLINDKVDLIPGTKGSGKSALFRMFTDFLPDILLKNKKVVVAHGVQRHGDNVFNAFKTEFERLSERDFVDFWCIYLVSLAHEQFIKGERYATHLQSAQKEIAAFRYACQQANIPEIKAEKTFRDILGWTLNALKKYAPRLKYNLPNEGGEVELDLFGNPATPAILVKGQESDPRPPTYVIEIKESLEKVLAKSGLSVWLMVDKLDELFPRRSEVERRALWGLLQTMRLFQSEQIRVKIFLRDDMLTNLLTGSEGFVALSHLVARQADTLRWSEQQILTMVVKRFFANEWLRLLLGVDRERLDASEAYRSESFYKIFPPRVHRGDNQSPTLRWICNRICDGNNVVTPRDIIDLLTKARQRQHDELIANPTGTSEFVIGASALQYGFSELSAKKRDVYLHAEFPHLWPHIEKFQGGKSSYSESGMEKMLGSKWREITSDFMAIGLISAHGKPGERTYSFPFLYRRALGLTQGSDGD